MRRNQRAQNYFSNNKDIALSECNGLCHSTYTPSLPCSLALICPSLQERVEPRPGLQRLSNSRRRGGVGVAHDQLPIDEHQPRTSLRQEAPAKPCAANEAADSPAGASSSSREAGAVDNDVGGEGFAHLADRLHKGLWGETAVRLEMETQR